MAKTGLDYFPVLCRFAPDTELLEAEFGLKGIAVLIKLYQRIYGGHGYYCEWNDEVMLLFTRRECGIPAGAEGCGIVSEVVETALRRGIFDEKVYKKYGVLTSAVIQETYLEAAKRRNSVEVKKEYLLLSAPKIPKNVSIVSENVCRNEKNAYRNGQSKVEESKVNKNKKSVRSAPPSVKEVAAYCAERKNGIDAEAFVAFYESKGWMVGKNEMRDWKAAVRTWEKRKGAQPQRGSTNSFNAFPQRDYNYHDLEQKLLAR